MSQSSASRRLRRAVRGKRTRLDLLLRGMRQVGKYSLPSVLLALAGCVPSANLIAVSPDGRYVVVPVHDRGVNLSMVGDARLVLIDLKTQTARALDPASVGPFWVRHAAGVTAVNHYRPQANDGSHFSVSILTKDSVTNIPDAVWPSLSADGRYLAYLTGLVDRDNSEGRTVAVRDLTDGGESRIDLAARNVRASLAEVAPDGKRVLVVATPTADADEPAWGLYVIDRDGSNMRRIAGIDNETQGSWTAPRWIDNKSVVFRTRTPDSPLDGELFVADLAGKTEQLTDNSVEDAFPVAVSRDKIVSLRVRTTTRSEEKLPVGAIYLSERRDGKWAERPLGVEASAFTVAGDRLIWMKQEGSVKDGQNPLRGRLFSAPLADPTKATDLSALIEKQVKDLPELKLEK